MVKSLEELIDLAKQKDKKTLSVAVAQDEPVIRAVIEAVDLGIVNAILVGDREKIINISKEKNIDISKIHIVDEKDTIKAAAKAVKLVSEGKAQYIMKGLLSTSILLKAVLNKEAGLRQKGLLSHVMVCDSPNYHKLLIVTDGGMVIQPDLKDKISIINNTLKVTKAFNIEKAKIAPICAVEVVNPDMQDTIDAAALTQMYKRGQIKNCIIDGPLALDNAISKEAAEHKGIKSEVAGDADVLLVPNITSGNFLAKTITQLGGGTNAGIIVGAKCPVVLVSRADSVQSKLYAIALGAVVS